MSRQRLAGSLILVIALAACAAPGTTATPPSPTPATGTYPGWPAGPDPNAQMVPLLVSSELVPGPNRFLFSLADTSNALIAAPDLATTATFFDLAADPAKAVTEASGTFIWTVPATVGLYHLQVAFTRAGPWGVEIVASKAGLPDRKVRAVFDVRASGSTPALGSKVPASDTPTATTAAGIAAISSDPSPDPDFYRQSVKGALAAGEPFVLIFATPLFCQSRTCGPTLDTVKSAAAPYKGRIEFIHVEPYQLHVTDTGLQPVYAANGDFQVVPAAAEWGLPSEPWTFVVRADGTLAAKFEGGLGADELRQALDALLGS
ncbi:MAG: TlpA family protein disulfide reductase [Candidatus Limnocylindrales bacterium]